MKKIFILFFFLTVVSVHSLFAGENLYSYRDYVSGFFSEEEAKYIRTWNYHIGDLTGSKWGLTCPSKKEVIISSFFSNRVRYYDVDFLSTVIHETIHVVLLYRNQYGEDDGHGIEFFNEAYRISRLFEKSATLKMSTEQIVGGIYEAKLVQIHSKGLRTDEEIDRELYLISLRQKKTEESRVNKPEKTKKPEKPVKTVKTKKVKSSSSHKPNFNFVKLIGVYSNFGVGYLNEWDGVTLFNNWGVGPAVLGFKFDYAENISFNAGGGAGLQLPLKFFDTISIIPDVKFTIDYTQLKNGNDIVGDFIDYGVNAEVSVSALFLTAVAGYSDYKKKGPCSYFGIGFYINFDDL